ncbi:MAG: RDD family protein [Candidatus Thiodiazotropha sp. (ex Myrtea sp. 'scaly one' KF741663)]|nr:RDD family protein [Candidatus Thiodiazotropha sp. (ex Myrtea sp. 'scaly one' KF741663)]
MTTEAQPPAAPRWRRLLAFCIDAVIWVLILYPVIQVILSGNESDIGAMVMNSFTAWVGVSGINLYLLHSRSQTIGKWVLNIQIRRSDSAHAGFSRKLFLRYLLPGLIVSIPYLGQLILLLDIATLFGPERRTLHDRLADTGVFLYPKTVSD